MSDERGSPLPLPLPLPLQLHLGLPIMKWRRHHLQLSSKGPDSLMVGSVLYGSCKARFSYGFSSFNGKRPSMEDYTRWKEYQHDIAIDLAAPFHRGSLAEAMMSKGVYQWMYIYLIPLGLIVLNAVTQAMNVAEEKSGGTPSAGGQAQQPAVVQHVSSSAIQ